MEADGVPPSRPSLMCEAPSVRRSYAWRRVEPSNVSPWGDRGGGAANCLKHLYVLKTTWYYPKHDDASQTEEAAFSSSAIVRCLCRRLQCRIKYVTPNDVLRSSVFSIPY